jgi:hypothetical protein
VWLSGKEEWLEKVFRAGQDPQRVVVPTIQLNSILYYLCAVPTATRTLTDTAQCR